MAFPFPSLVLSRLSSTADCTFMSNVLQRHSVDSTTMAPTKHSSSKRKRLGNNTIVAFQRWISLRPKQSVFTLTILVIFIIHLHPTTKQISTKLLLRSSHTITIPECPTSPWKENESLHGNCQGSGLKLNPDIHTATECATSCCTNPKCITFQYRSDVGCSQGDDVRLGLEKDGAPTWCNDSPPEIWRGQYLVPRVQDENGKDVVYSDAEKNEFRKKNCDLNSWSPNERRGQCFGLGGKRVDASGSDAECMQACCADENCGAWQWSKDSGCFYNKWMFGCLDGSVEGFVGRRKFLEGRSYTDGSGKPYHQNLG